jgi:hypothetical protein
VVGYRQSDEGYDLPWFLGESGTTQAQVRLVAPVSWTTALVLAIGTLARLEAASCFKDCTVDALRSIVTVFERSVFRHINPPLKWASLSPRQQDDELAKLGIALDPKLLLLARKAPLISLIEAP